MCQRYYWIEEIYGTIMISRGLICVRDIIGLRKLYSSVSLSLAKVRSPNFS